VLWWLLLLRSARWQVVFKYAAERELYSGLGAASVCYKTDLEALRIPLTSTWRAVPQLQPSVCERFRVLQHGKLK